MTVHKTWLAIGTGPELLDARRHRMTYPRLRDLPKSVRDNLPKEAQEIYREAFNNAWEQ